ncbi:MAG: glycosyltransferase family 2 protein [Alphaproteobacteria bacterium]
MTLARFHDQLSVVIPVYNVARYLPHALASVDEQAPYIREIVVVDDGSTDDSAAVAEAFGPKVHVIRAEHRGIGAARNRGLAATSGEFLAILDADDVWPANSIAARFAAFAADPALDLVSGHMVEFHSDDLGAEDRARLRARTQPRAGYAPGTVVFRRSLLERVGGYREDIAISEFIEWMGRVNETGARTAILPTTVLLRRIHAANTSHLNAAKAKDYVRVLRESIERRRKRTDGSAPQ